MRTDRKTIIVVETKHTTPDEHERIVRELLAQDLELTKRHLTADPTASISLSCAPAGTGA